MRDQKERGESYHGEKIPQSVCCMLYMQEYTARVSFYVQVTSYIMRKYLVPMYVHNNN